MAATDIYNSISTSQASEVLRFLLTRDSLSLDDVASEMNQAKRKQILDDHPYSIFQGKDGRWRTTVEDASKKDGRRHIVKSSRDKLLDAIVNHYEQKEEITSLRRITLERLYPQWLEHKQLHTNAEASIYRIKTEWKKHYQGTEIVKVPIIGLTKLQLDEWAHKLIKDNNMSKKQYYNTTLIMRQALEYAVDLNIIDSSPFDRVKIDAARMFRRISKPASETQVFSADELSIFHQSAWEDFETRRHYKHQLIPLAVLFFFQTGMRISEICAVKYEDIEGDALHIKRMYSDFDGIVKDRTKGYFGDRDVPLTADAKMLIERARERQQEEGVCSEGYIFSMTGDPVPYSELRKTFYKYCNEAGFLPKSSHKARKTVISTLIDDGVNINTIREMMGQKDERTTLGNYCFDRKEKEERQQLISKSLSRMSC